MMHMHNNMHIQVMRQCLVGKVGVVAVESRNFSSSFCVLAFLYVNKLR